MAQLRDSVLAMSVNNDVLFTYGNTRENLHFVNPQRKHRRTIILPINQILSFQQAAAHVINFKFARFCLQVSPLSQKTF